jgi:hypothetical protein
MRSGTCCLRLATTPSASSIEESPNPDAWTATLIAAGFPAPRFQETRGDADTDEPCSAAA